MAFDSGFVARNPLDDDAQTGSRLCASLDAACEAMERAEALAYAASQALAGLPFSPAHAHPRAVGRLFHLVEATAEAVTRALETIESAGAREAKASLPRESPGTSAIG